MTTEKQPALPVNPRNWTEDFAHENGKYHCHCTNCGNTFIGHKRRVTCKLCASLPPPVTPSETEEEIALECAKRIRYQHQDAPCTSACDQKYADEILAAILKVEAIRKSKAQAQVTLGEGGKLLYAASSALLGLLQHAGIADQHTEDIDSVDHKAESVARNIREQIRAFLEREKASPETTVAPEDNVSAVLQNPIYSELIERRARDLHGAFAAAANHQTMQHCVILETKRLLSELRDISTATGVSSPDHGRERSRCGHRG